MCIDESIICQFYIAGWEHFHCMILSISYFLNCFYLKKANQKFPHYYFFNQKSWLKNIMVLNMYQKSVKLSVIIISTNLNLYYLRMLPHVGIKAFLANWLLRRFLKSFFSEFKKKILWSLWHPHHSRDLDSNKYEFTLPKYDSKQVDQFLANWFLKRCFKIFFLFILIGMKKCWPPYSGPTLTPAEADPAI